MADVQDKQLAHDGEQRDQHHGAELDDAMLALGHHQQRRLNSRAMMTVKIMPNTA
jgi:hypothetical protein